MDYSQTSYSDTPRYLPLNRKNPAVTPCATAPKRAASPACMSIVETCGSLALPPGVAEWIASQRDSLARILAVQARAQELKREQEADLLRRSTAQLTLFAPPSSSSKTAPRSEPEAGTLLSRNLWREDIPGATDSCRRLMLALPTSGTAGGSLLPTLTASEVSGGRTVPPGTTLSGMTPDGKKVQVGIKTALKMLPTLTTSDGSGGPGVSQKRQGGMNLRTAITRLPTLCSTDYKSPYSAEGYAKQTLTRSKPLRDTLAHTTGHRLTAAFAEWWMGWPLKWTATRKAKESKRPATGKCPSRRPQHG